jgi:hypothetical protein
MVLQWCVVARVRGGRAGQSSAASKRNPVQLPVLTNVAIYAIGIERCQSALYFKYRFRYILYILYFLSVIITVFVN